MPIVAVGKVAVVVGELDMETIPRRTENQAACRRIPQAERAITAVPPGACSAGEQRVTMIERQPPYLTSMAVNIQTVASGDIPYVNVAVVPARCHRTAIGGERQ